MRELQENEISFAHQLSELEDALAAEAHVFRSAFEEAGIVFDPLTCVAMRFVNECVETQINPADVLAAVRDLGVLDRAVELANEHRSGEDAP
jgi:hypothetical protein